MSSNISKEKRDILVNKIKEIKQFIASSPQDENTSTLLSYIADIEKDIKGKKYGLVFEEHKEAIDELLESHTPVLSEEKDLFIDNDGQMNFLLEGDNLASLQLLEKTHKGAIDFIYIDPPYNTGNKDFVYDDSIIDTNDNFRHSKWLSFMKKRLKIANSLLSNIGVIFISIDDNELSQLKILCDEIFDEKNFVGCICRATGTTTGQDANKIGSSLDYCLVYSKTNQFVLKGLPLTEKDLKRFKEEDSNGRYSILQLRKTGNEDRKENRPNMFYSVIAPDGSLVYPFGPTKYLSRWRVSKESYDKLEADNMIVWKKNNKFEQINIDGYDNSPWVPYVKYYAENRTKQVSNLFQDIEGNKKASLDLKSLVKSNVKFDYPKPVEFINILLKIGSESNSHILDFFAGSGTTGHAVMKLNAEDGGNRNFILCTNNENNICRDVTYERIKRVIEKEDYKASLKYMKVDFVPISDKLYYEYADELLKHIKELVELENGINFDGNKELEIILTEEELDTFTSNISCECKTIYLGHDVLPTEEQEDLFKKHKIKVNIIPDYYYRDLEG